MNVRDYQKWVDSKVHSFSNLLSDKKNPAKLLSNAMQQHPFQIKYTLCIDNFIIYVNLYTTEIIILNAKTMKSAKARCHFTDTFNVYVGIAVAWAKYNHEAVPQIEKTIKRDELKNGDKFISSINNKVVTFIGWIPDSTNGMIGKWAIVLDEKGFPLKTQVAEEVSKMS